MTDYGTLGDSLARRKQEAVISKPSRAAKLLPPSEAGKYAREATGHTESTLDDILASVAPSLSDEPETVAVSLLDMAGDHPLAIYAREVADSIQISRDSTFMIGLGLTSAVGGLDLLREDALGCRLATWPLRDSRTAPSRWEIRCNVCLSKAI